MLNIGTGLASSLLSPGSPSVLVINDTAIAVQWLSAKTDSTLTIEKPPTKDSAFGATVFVEAAALGIAKETEVNIVVSGPQMCSQDWGYFVLA